MEAVVGPRLVRRDGSSAPTGSALGSSAYVGLYFSAHWCGPCRGFTPQLVEFYESMGRDQLEIVFVSSDKSGEEMASYLSSMPWPAVPFEDGERRKGLGAKFRVKGIPTLVIVDGATGEVITTEGRAGVSGSGRASFPWRRETADEILRTVPSLLASGGDPVPTSSLDSKYLFLYFSAHWCPPCRGFTPRLAAFYERLRASGARVEIVFVSSDKSRAQFDEYFAEMPWLALPYDLRDQKLQLSKCFEVEGIPSLALLSPVDPVSGERRVVSRDARPTVADPDAVPNFPDSFAPKPYADIATTVECGGVDINDAPALVVLAEKSPPDVQRAAVDAVKTVAPTRDGTLFFYATSPDGPVARLRALCRTAASRDPTLLKLDIPNANYYLAPPLDVLTPAAITAFLADPGPPTPFGS